MSETELLPCPFCGGEAETWEPTSALMKQAGEFFIIQCDCGDDDLSVLLEAKSGIAAINAWNRRVAASEWISVEDRLPELDCAVVVWGPDFDGTVAERQKVMGGMWYWFVFPYYSSLDYEITHWQPLPDPPNDPDNCETDAAGL